MYRKVPTDMKFVEREKETLRLWKEKGIIEKCFHCRDGAERFTFFDGPPTANGRPHIGHIETRAIKDLIPRFQTMKGKDVLRKAGWDSSWVWTASLRSRPTASSPSSRSARKASGNTSMNGKKCLTGSATGRIWSIPISPTRTIISSPSGGA